MKNVLQKSLNYPLEFLRIVYYGLLYSVLKTYVFLMDTIKNKVSKKFVFGYSVFFLLIVHGRYVYAEELTDIFTSPAFQGSFEFLSNFNIIGKIMSNIISLTCLIGLFLIVVTTMVDYVYKASPNIWDSVAEVHEAASKGSGGFGIPQVGKEIYEGKWGSGADALVALVYSLLPNILEHSSFGSKGDIDKSIGVLAYTLKVFPNRLIIMIMLTLGFNGTLWQLYGTCIEGATAITDNVVAVNAEVGVNKLISYLDSYNFTLDADMDSKGDAMQSAAKKAYLEVVGKGGITDYDLKQNIGYMIETQIREGFDKNIDLIATATGVGDSASDDMWDGVNVNTVLSQTDAHPEFGFMFEVSEYFGGRPTYLKVHFVVQRVKSNYFNSGTADMN